MSDRTTGLKTARLTAILALWPAVATTSWAGAEKLEPILVAIDVSDLEVATTWYEKKLGFKKKRFVDLHEHDLTIQFLEKDGFRLELIERSASASRSSLELAEGGFGVHGMTRLGFLSGDVDGLFEKLSASGDTLTELHPELPPARGVPWPWKGFMARDPDGNALVFYDQTLTQDLDGDALVPFLAYLSVSDTEKAARFYEERLGFVRHEPANPKDREGAYLSRDRFLVFLRKSPWGRPRDTLELPEGSSEIEGFLKLSFKTSDLDHLYEAHSTAESEILTPPSPSSAGFASRHFIVSDEDGLAVQFFER